MPDRTAPPATSGPQLNDEVIARFRACGGVVDGPLAGTPLVLLHHVGARSGLERVTPLAVSLHLDNGLVVVAANGGAAQHPGWYFNLKAHPDATVEYGTEVYRARAEEVRGRTREEIWDRIVAGTSSPAAFQAATDRLIPVIVLTKVGTDVQHLSTAGRRTSEVPSHRTPRSQTTALDRPSVGSGRRVNRYPCARAHTTSTA